MSRESSDLLRVLSSSERMPLSDAPELLRDLSDRGYVSLRLASGGTVAVITDEGRAALESYEYSLETRRIAKRANVIAAVAAAIALAAFLKSIVC